MKLRNKKTGKVIDINLSVNMVDEDYISVYGSLEEFNEDWEDYEEPKYIWYIDWKGNVQVANYDNDWKNEKSIGNYFETKEEAEKAVEKLKAWERLKDNGFKFDRWNNASAGSYRPIWFYFEKDTLLDDIKSDLDLLFGGGE